MTLIRVFITWGVTVRILVLCQMHHNTYLKASLCLVEPKLVM
jgi:hypothetical protein